MSGRPRILLAGGTGQVGWELRRALAPLGEVVAPPRAGLDLFSADSLRAAVRDLAPRLVVNAAAYTEVDRAESEPARAHAANAVAPAVLAGEAARLGAPLVHFSTDYVFDGAKGSPYVEDDPCAPLGVYGASKREGELAVAGAGGPHLVFRTSWVYGLRGKNFLRTMLRLARERDELRVVDDQRGAPTWSRMVAEATALVVARLGDGRGGFAPEGAPWGTYHLSAGGETTWCGFAREVLALDPRREEQRCREVVPIRTEEYPTPARRPRYSVLDGARLQAAFGVRLPGWREALEMAMAEAGEMGA